ncbi:hypothetical protein PS011_22980, partial [Shigella sonnei]|nr:hypothetical protein [Shigella sonnei]
RSALHAVCRWKAALLLESDAPLAEVLPSIYKQHEERYAGYTLRSALHAVCRWKAALLLESDAPLAEV